MALLNYTEKHNRFRKDLRAFCQKEIVPYIDLWERAGRVPKEVWPKIGRAGFLCTAVPKQYGGMGSDLSSLKSTAVETRDEVIIDGTKTFISNLEKLQQERLLVAILAKCVAQFILEWTIDQLKQEKKRTSTKELSQTKL